MSVLANDIMQNPCICGSQNAYKECCFPFHNGDRKPATAEQLMRSRYAAFQLGMSDYLLSTWADETRPENIEFTPGLRWQKLNVNGRKKGRKKDLEGWVTFVAYYLLGSENGALHETSYFKRDCGGDWKYVDGEIKGS